MEVRRQRLSWPAFHPRTPACVSGLRYCPHTIVVVFSLLLLPLQIVAPLLLDNCLSQVEIVSSVEIPGLSIQQASMDQSLLNGGVEWSACVAGFTLAGLQWGDSIAPRTALCLHGWMDNSMSFSALAPHLSHLGVWLGSSFHGFLMPLLIIVFYAGYRVVAVDMPGHGRSQHLPACCGHYSAEAHIRICAALLGQSPSCSLFTPDLFNRSAQHFSGNSDFPPQILLIGHR